MRTWLYITLILLLAFADGFYFDRWLHRPIVVRFTVPQHHQEIV